MTAPALALSGITKRFGTTTALDGVSLVARAGTVHALLGENGAGKTTLMHVAFGMTRPDAGTVAVNGVVRTLRSPADAIETGIGMVHQHFMLVDAMTVAENVALGGRGRYDAARAGALVRDTAARHGLHVDPGAVAGSLPVGARQRVEILKALARDARILVLDEPTAVLAPAETAELLRTLRAFATGGGTVVLITHKLREALELADDVTVLRRGRNVLSAHAGDLTEAELARAMIGAARADETRTGDLAVVMQDYGRPVTIPGGHEALVLRDVAVRDARGVAAVDGVTLAVRSGEILGIAAVEGNGQHELLRVMAGRLEPTSGSVRVHPPPGLARAAVPGFIPEDRHRDALVLEFPLYENVALAAAGYRRGVVDWGAVRTTTAAVISAYDVRAPGVGTRAHALSGGNQQKLVVGRELHAAPAVLVAENPSRGLDVHATAAVQERLRTARDAGAAVVVYSGDLDEVLALADRMVVMYRGHAIPVPLDRDVIGRAMLGA